MEKSNERGISVIVLLTAASNIAQPSISIQNPHYCAILFDIVQIIRPDCQICLQHFNSSRDFVRTNFDRREGNFTFETIRREGKTLFRDVSIEQIDENTRKRS